MIWILSKYFLGVLSKLKAEVDLLNEIIPHNLTKWENNEESLKNVIRSLIPKKYSVGSGIIIDSFGNQSRQCDIVIYDDSTYPNIFNQSSNSIFPVETVLACIEVKTYLNDSILKDVCNNTESLKKLKHYVPSININSPSEEYPINLKSARTKPPLSWLIAFRSDSSNPETWKRRFLWKELKNLPDCSYIIDDAVSCFFENNEEKTQEKLIVTLTELRECDIDISGNKDNVYHCDKPNINFVLWSATYKSSGLENREISESNCKYPVIMPERWFLSFLMWLLRAIEDQPKHIFFDIEKYTGEDYNRHRIIE